MYLEEFRGAIGRTNGYGLCTKDISIEENKRFISEESLRRMRDSLDLHLGEMGIDEIAAQCMLLNLRIKKRVSELLRSQVYFTIGHVEFDGDSLFYQSEQSLKNMLKHGIDGPSVNIHAWLTLPSMEILDFSFGTSYAVATGDKRGMGAVIVNHADNLTGGMKYHPMVIGSEYLHKIGAIQVLPA